MAEETTEENFENDGGAVSEAATPPEGGQGGSPAEETFNIPREHWETVVGSLYQTQQQVAAFQEYLQSQGQGDPGDETDEEDVDADAAQFVRQVMQTDPAYVAQQEQVGTQRMNAIFDQLEKNPHVGKFNRNYAKSLAEANFQPGADPAAVVAWAAQTAAAERKAEYESWKEEYKKSVTPKGFSDPGVGGAATKSVKLKPGSYADMADQVIDQWAGREEV